MTCPVTGGGAAVPPYVSYARMDQLHELARPRTDSPQELNFILISHVKELLFRIIHTDLDLARTRLREDRPREACARLAAAVRGQRVLIASWDAVTGMTPDEFMAFREILGEASGTQSFMYRALEFLLGNKDPAAVRFCAEHLDLYPILKQELSGRSLYDEALTFLARRGAAIPAHVLEARPGAQYEPCAEVEDAWLAVYREPQRFPDEHLLAEALTEVSFQFAHWRSAHLLVVERMLGSKHGTGGTTGLEWLRSINDHRFFPELWSARTRL